MNISDIAVQIVDLVQAETINKAAASRVNKQVANILHKLVGNLADAEDEYVVVINMDSGIPQSVLTNNPALNGALFVCTDNISVADDEEAAVVVYDDTIVVSSGVVEIDGDMHTFVKAEAKFSKLNG